MVRQPLSFVEGHLFVRLDEADWLLDTGAPTSFGGAPSLTIGGRTFQVAKSYMGLSPETLSNFVCHQTAGIIGTDIFNAFDTLFDVPDGTVSFSSESVGMSGETIEIEDFMGIPTFGVKIAGTSHRMVFDTGAQLSYFQDDSISEFPRAASMTDFLPALGQFETETFMVDMTLGASHFTLRCGRLPGLLGMALSLTGAAGIVGNEILRDRPMGFLPRKNILMLVEKS